MNDLLSIVKNFLPIEIAILIVIFIYFLKLFKEMSSDFNKIAQQQADYMRQRVDSVDKTTTIFERTIDHQEKDLRKMYDDNEQLKKKLELKNEESVEHLDTQLKDIVEGMEEIRQEKISKEEFEQLKDNLSAAKIETNKRYKALIDSISSKSFDDFEYQKNINKAFVVTSFSPDAKKRYELIKTTVQEAGMKIFKADETLLPGMNIYSHVKSCIESSDLILVDITGKKPNVMYELGYAHALDKPVILLATNMSEISFDISTYKIVIFDETARGFEILKQRLRESIAEIKLCNRSKKMSEWLQIISTITPYASIAKLIVKKL